MGETYGNLLIAIENQVDFSASKFDPRYLTITAKILTGNSHILNPGGDTVMDVELDFASLDKHPGLFDSYLRNYLSEDGESNIIVLKDPSKVNLVDNFIESNTANQLVFQIHKCDKKTSSVKCASDREIDRYIENYTVNIGSLTNFIDYSDVSTKEDGIVQQSLSVLENNIKMNYRRIGYSFIEH